MVNMADGKREAMEQFQRPVLAAAVDHPVIGAVAESRDEDWIAVGTRRSSEGAIEAVDFVVYTNPSGLSATIYLDDQGLPYRAEDNGYIFLMDNYTESTVDMVVINRDGETTLHRSVPIDPSVLLALAPQMEGEFAVQSAEAVENSGMSTYEVVRHGLFAVSVFGCGTAVILSAPTVAGSIAIGAACGSALLSGIAIGTDSQAAAFSATSMGTFMCATSPIHTAGAMDCLIVAGTVANEAFFASSEEISTRQSSVTEAENLLIAQTHEFLRLGHYEITVTLGRYADQSDWDEAVKSELGNEWSVLDWSLLKSLVQDADTATAVAELIGAQNQSAFVLRNGSKQFSSTRYYFASAHYGSRPGHYLAHDNIYNFTISLGSWDTTRRIMAVREL